MPCPRTWSRGAPPNDKNPAARPGREALGRSRGGLSTKIHLAADRRCRPVARILSPGQHGDCPRFIPLLQAIRIARRGPGRPRTRPGAAIGDRRTPRRPTAPTCASAGSRRSSRSRKTRRNTAAPAAARAADRPPSTPDVTKSATPSSGVSPSSSSSAASRPGTTSASSCTRAPSTSRRSGSGYGISSHDPRGHAPTGLRPSPPRRVVVPGWAK